MWFNESTTSKKTACLTLSVDKALAASYINSEMDNVGNIGSRRRAAGNHYSAEEQALDQIAKEVNFEKF